MEIEPDRPFSQFNLKEFRDKKNRPFLPFDLKESHDKKIDELYAIQKRV